MINIPIVKGCWHLLDFSLVIAYTDPGLSINALCVCVCVCVCVKRWSLVGERWPQNLRECTRKSVYLEDEWHG